MKPDETESNQVRAERVRSVWIVISVQIMFGPNQMDFTLHLQGYAMRRNASFCCLFFLAMTVVSPASCFAQVTDRPTGGISIATLHQSIERLETQREELLTQLRELNAPIPFTSLQDAVALCNSKAAVHADASTQTPLTEDELVAAVTMSLAHLRERKSRDETQDHFVDCLDRILQERKLRMDAKLELVTRMSTADGTELDVWNIRLLIPAKNEGQKYAVTIREAFIRVRPVDANQSNPATGQVAEKNAG